MNEKHVLQTFAKWLLMKEKISLWKPTAWKVFGTWHLKELLYFVKKTPLEDLKQHLRIGIILQCLMHTVDAKERSHLNRINENLTVLLERQDENEGEEEIEFPSVDQMINTIQNKNKENTSTNETWKFQQPLAG